MRNLLILMVSIFIMSVENTNAQKSSGQYNPLTPEEMRVILQKGTERPGSGIYNSHFENGTYTCKRCDAELYKSDSKFDGHCGWPSFDDEIPGAVRRETDSDGHRTEILCNNCGAHLGHVFNGEGFTEKNVRHCVNSISLNFVATEKEAQTQTAYFAGGCFWGVEHLMEKEDGVISVRSGYMGGEKENPTYEEVCYTNTGHIEAVEVKFESDKVSFEKLAKLFFEIHDPTQVGRQGPDIGEQYSSVVFYANEEQKKTTFHLIKLLENKGYNIATKVVDAGKFWPAEDYHQDYYKKTRKQPYCHFYTKRF